MSTQPTLCPRCETFKPHSITLNHPQRGIVFSGCGDCLIAMLDVLSSYQAPQCSTCGTAKKVLSFDNGAQRLECPVHAMARGLLGRALQALTPFKDESDQVRAVRDDIIHTLGIRQAT